MICVPHSASLQWRHNGRDSVSNHQPHIVFSTVYSDAVQRKLQAPRHWPFCGEFNGDRWIDEFPAQMASNAENISISWRHHATRIFGHPV